MLKWIFGQKASRSRDGLDLPNSDAALTHEMAAILAKAGVPTFRKTLPRLNAEVNRARRYERPLTIALVWDARPPEPAARGGIMGARRGRKRSGADPSPLGIGSPLIPVVIASVLTEIVRDIDIVTYAASLGRFLVLMPETSEAQGRQAIERVAEICVTRLMLPVQARVAIFRDHGWTLEELVRHAMEADGDPTAASRETAGPRAVPDAERIAV
jgi:GGDEF domain-containing protein